MSTCWAIIIGINQYQGFQPLMQAQNDAVGIRRYLIDDAGFAPENCILLSDLSTSTEQEAVYPDRMAIRDWLETVCQGRVQKDDTLWFYFSGYGAQADNKDYLMPVDGDPAQVKQTGIALQDVVKYLKQAPTKNTMMVLDMNRSQSALAGQAIGDQVTKLASKARIPLLLSCQPDEFSHETLAVRHGLFTAALLEGVRYDGCATLSHLERYLIERVPELCEHHWRPIQNPVVLLPEEQKFQILWHQRNVATADPVANPVIDSPAAAQPDAETPAVDQSLPDSAVLIPDNPDADLAVLIPDNPDADLAEPPELIPEPVPEMDLENDLPEESAQSPLSLEDVDDDVYGTSTVENIPDEPPPVKGRSNGCLGLLGALGALLLLLAVLLRNQPLVQTALQDRVPPEWLERVGLNRDGADEPDGTDGATPDNPDADPPVGMAETDTPGPATGASGEPAASDSASTPGTAAVGTTVAPAEDSAAPGEATSDTAALLNEARRSLRPSQASVFASAIATARQIPPGDPNYAQAQADIQRWSQVILDLAEGRAAESELDAAINAARLISTEPANIYQEAQARSGVWQARAETRELIREAQAIPRTGQASTYQEGILKLQAVSVEQPIEYADAQRLIDEWSERMLAIAQARAAQGQYDSAIEAAALIPEETAAYDQAQSEMQRWREQ